MSDDERMPRPGADGTDPEDAKPAARPEPRAEAAADAPERAVGPSAAPGRAVGPGAADAPREREVGPGAAEAPPERAVGPGAAPGEPVPRVEPPSPEIELAQDASPLPGAHRGGFRRLPTAPIAVTVQSAPAEPGTEDSPPQLVWAPAEESGLHRGLAGWALAFAVVGLAVSLFVGWGFPIGIVAIVSAILALRRPLESRRLAVWAIAIGAVSMIYSAGWLLYAAWRADLLG
ncbi:hypothetical protein [Microbacterium cremeum]|uniref:hypothetical protein n=1 Tax=Microbacterium cremeum TaxID=2782169 RepID=UPI001889A69C|nr:hypothetical protein [Microbacterium cremeum]